MDSKDELNKVQFPAFMNTFISLYLWDFVKPVKWCKDTTYKAKCLKLKCESERQIVAKKRQCLGSLSLCCTVIATCCSANRVCRPVEGWERSISCETVRSVTLIFWLQSFNSHYSTSEHVRLHRLPDFRYSANAWLNDSSRKCWNLFEFQCTGENCTFSDQTHRNYNTW